MRIAIVTDWFAPRVGGIESQLEQLAQRLGRRGHIVDVITTTPGTETASGFRARRLDVMRLPGMGIAISPRLPGLLVSELRGGYDVVHCHVSVVSPLGYAAAIVARSLNMPTLITFHSVLRHKRHLLRAATTIVSLARSGIRWSAVSSSVARQAASALGAPVSVLPNGADVSYWRAAREALRGEAQRSRIVFVFAGRLQRKKRPLALVRRFVAAARNTGVPACLLIAGDGPERPSIERASRELPAGTVRLLGWRGRDELRDLYASADAFVIASRHESFGIAALEARASHLPIIAMRSAGCSDFLRHEQDALLCSDDDDFEVQLSRFLLDDAMRARLRVADPTLGRYDWDAVVTEHERAYVDAMTSGDAVRPAERSV
jgi:glycosyltransferase involved in cell wall biosynthesis